MYQLGTKWKLWGLPSFLQADIEAITLRGYSTEPEEIAGALRLPADLYLAGVDDKGSFKGLSVEKVTSRYCPTGRDLYLEKKLGSRGSKGHITWGRVAGRLIEEYCLGLLEHFRDWAQGPAELDYQRIQMLTDDYSRRFWNRPSHKKNLRKLQNEAGIPEEAPERLAFLLQQTAKYELTMLSADYILGQSGDGEFVPLMEGIPIVFKGEAIQINPQSDLGLSETTTPDFIIFDNVGRVYKFGESRREPFYKLFTTIWHIFERETAKRMPEVSSQVSYAPEPTIVMGEVKTGTQLQPFHLHAVAGYAISYESQHKRDVNFGIVYFFETHVTQMSFAQSYVFVIDDFLRRKFLDARNDAYRILQKSALPPKAGDYEKYCKYCKHHEDCYANAK